MAAIVDNSMFITDPSFCPSCGLILPLPGLHATITCELCSYEQSTEGMPVDLLLNLD